MVIQIVNELQKHTYDYYRIYEKTRILWYVYKPKQVKKVHTSSVMNLRFIVLYTYFKQWTNSMYYLLNLLNLCMCLNSFKYFKKTKKYYEIKPIIFKSLR